MLYFDYYNHSIKNSVETNTLIAIERVKEAFPGKAIFFTYNEIGVDIFSRFLKIHGIDSLTMVSDDFDLDMLPIVFWGEYFFIIDMKDLPVIKLLAEKQDLDKQADVTLAFEDS